VRNPVLRIALVTGLFIAVLVVGGAGAGVALADPEDPGTGTGTDPSAESPTPNEPQPVTGTTPVPQPSIFDLPQTIANQLRDMFGKPLSIFGNGRVPGTHTVPETGTPSGSSSGSKRDRPGAKADPDPPAATPPEPVEPEPAPAKRRGTGVEVVLPFAPPISVPLPPPPGNREVQLTLDFRDPGKAYASVQQTLTTVNSLLADAYASYDPFQPPAPRPQPQPTFRILQEGPVLDAGVDGGSGTGTPISAGSPDLPVLQAPIVVPGIVAPLVPVPAPVRGVAPPPAVAPPAAVAEAVPPAVRAPAGRETVREPLAEPPAVRPGTPAEALPAASPMGTPAVREGYPQYLRSARLGEVATVALPGLAGLLALTVSGGAIGYRQANSGRYLRADAARFLS
jgi:hypothetical protein